MLVFCLQITAIFVIFIVKLSNKKNLNRCWQVLVFSCCCIIMYELKQLYKDGQQCCMCVYLLFLEFFVYFLSFFAFVTFNIYNTLYCGERSKSTL